MGGGIYYLHSKTRNFLKLNSISDKAYISKHADIETSSKGSKLHIGDSVFIDSFVKIKFTGGLGNVTIDKNSYINSGCVFYSGNGISIGENVLIAANCTFAAVNHEFKDRNKLIINQRFKESKGGIIIEDDVWIGANTIILDGAIIKKGAVIGAGSLVNEIIEEYSVCAGNPLKIITKRK